jgi:hypothetical protein
MEPKIAYDNLIQVMDAVRGTEIRTAGSLALQRVELFPHISIGDAP